MTFERAMALIGIALIAFLIGSFSPAIIISNSVQKRDIRKYGSGNAGTTNMARTFGVKFGAFTFLGDVLKGALVAYLSILASQLLGEIGIRYAVIAGSVFVVVGHNWPVYYSFRGGKGVATTLGVLLVHMPVPTLVCLVPTIAIMLISKTVSLGSIMGVLFAVIAAFIAYPQFSEIHILVITLAILVWLLHSPNIKRLLNGNERKFDLTKKHGTEEK